MNDTLGAAPYTEPPAPSLWERVVSWWRERNRTYSGEELRERIDADLAAMPVEERDRLIDAHLPPSLRRSPRACGAVHPGRCPRERAPQ